MLRWTDDKPPKRPQLFTTKTLLLVCALVAIALTLMYLSEQNGRIEDKLNRLQEELHQQVEWKYGKPALLRAQNITAVYLVDAHTATSSSMEACLKGRAGWPMRTSTEAKRALDGFVYSKKPSTFFVLFVIEGSRLFWVLYEPEGGEKE